MPTALLPVLATALLLLLALLALAGVVVVQLAAMLIRPPRMTDGKALYVLGRMSPGDVGLDFEPVDFDVVDDRAAASRRRLRIAAWWLPAATPAASHACIVIHGFGDAKVGALAWAPTLRALGVHQLLIDLRAHGESGGEHCTGGDRERSDVAQVIDQLRAQRPDQTRTLSLFGISLGGAVALATAAGRTDIDAVVADSVFTDFRDAARVHGQLIRAPLARLQPLAIRLGSWWAGARYADVRPIDTVGRCSSRVMLIHGADDPFVPGTQLADLAAALAARGNSRDQHLVMPGAGHCMSIVADPDMYHARLAAFMTAPE